MLRDLTIKNYRCFKDFSIDGLARVNLIVGKNNSGKTSFLEAVYLLVNQRRPISLYELLDYRSEFVENAGAAKPILYYIRYIFHSLRQGHEEGDFAPITITSQRENSLALHAQLGPRRTSFGYDVPGLDLRFSYGPNALTEPARLALEIDEGYFGATNGRFNVLGKPTDAFQFVIPNLVDYERLAANWDTISLNPEKENTVVSALRILEPDVEDIRLASRQTPGRFLLKMKGHPERFPINSMGGGMRHMMTIIASAVIAEGGVLLVDEIDSGLYHGIQSDMWRLLIEIAQRLNLQIFATTHSWDCVVAFQDALRQVSHVENGEPLGLLFRIETRNGVLRKVKYDVRDLEIAVEQDIEVR